MTDNDTAEKKSLIPHFLVGALILIGLVAVYFWQADPEPAPRVEEPVAMPVDEPQVPEPEPELDPDAAAPLETPENMQPPAPEPTPEPEPLDITDGAVKTAVLETGEYEAMARLLVDEDLLRRFVVFSKNLSDEQLAANHGVLQPPKQEFRVYRQAGKEWIDAASYKRYTPYVEALDSLDTDQLIQLYGKYKPAINEVMAELGEGSRDFDTVLTDAINHLLDTPEVPMPVEVTSDSVMYKYVDERLESLTPPQKQLLRTGPENMRVIKAKLREIRDALMP